MKTVAGVIGWPVRHSLSPAIHEAAFAAAGLDWTFAAFEVAPGRVGDALAGMRALGLGGLSVTMPHKDDAARLADRRTPAVERLGSANCLIPTRDGLLADSTDGLGFLRSLVDVGVDVSGLRCCVLGAGGAARAVIAALHDAGATEVQIVNRTEERARAAALLAGPAARVLPRPDRPDLLVNATSVGMGEGPGLPVDPADLPGIAVVADLVYHPLVTPLLAAATAAGGRTVDGLGMLVHQAALAFEAWTEVEAPVAAMRAAAVAELARREAAAAAAESD